MKSRTAILLSLSALIALAAFLVFNRKGDQPSPPVTVTQNAVAPAAPAPEPAPVAAPAAQPVTESDTSTRSPEPAVKKTSAPVLRADAKSPKPATKAKSSKPPIQDPDARAALALVGTDPVAEDYWIQAINDPSLSPTERQDLIEDLNEDGLSDPKHPRPEDMPIIASRIALIEELAPDAADEVNAKAFAEAYKDLVKLWKGQPVD